MAYVDAHCHLEQYPDPQAEVAFRESSRIYTIAVTNLPDDFLEVRRLTADGKCVRAAVGLHPKVLSQFPGAILDLLPLLPTVNYVGEIGLDYAVTPMNQRGQQRQVFEEIVTTCEALGGRVLSIRSRRAQDDAVDMLVGVKNSTVILHSFEGDRNAIERATKTGFYFSVSAALTHSSTGQVILRSIPLDRLLTETTRPSLHAGSAAHRTRLPDAISRIARVLGMDLDELRPMIVNNFHQAVALPRNHER